VGTGFRIRSCGKDRRFEGVSHDATKENEVPEGA
jgi:hypothetical protein